MARKLKLTGFARFFILLLILTPIAYMVASYVNGEDGLGNIKRLIGIAEQTDSPAEERKGQTTTLPVETSDTQGLEEQIQALNDSIRAKDLQIQELKREIRILKGSRG
jgi:hypothetical protein